MSKDLTQRSMDNKVVKLSGFPKKFTEKGQGLVEFSLTFLILLTLIFGIIEFGRLFYYYSTVSSAAREASRYGAASGNNGGGTPFYKDCAGIKAAAVKIGSSAGVTTSNVLVTFDRNLTPLPGIHCQSGGSPPASVALGDRVKVDIDVTYVPAVPISIFNGAHVIGKSAHTIITNVTLP